MRIEQLPQRNIKEVLRPKKLRVAAYCRVSTKDSEQINSYSNQIAYYEEHIKSNPEWIYKGVFADACSGRHNTKMLELKRLLDLCRDREIDLILMKSISRMGRNTFEVLVTCNELIELGVEVYFEMQHLHLNHPESRLIISIFASLYQNESETLSFSIKWGIRKSFADGTSKMIHRKCYGYKQDSEGVLVIDEFEAVVVRSIYKWRHKGCSLRRISDLLEENKIAPPRKGAKWCPETIRKILKNEKYYGYVLLQKTYVPDYIGSAVRTRFSISSAIYRY